ncbi:carbohydrate sulfotransferase 11-like, partial [Branchiostoma floridae]|uniref:Carbohydrate sulfotransferase n=1 Tax=Branchiostoma floridae TaxID=7739 RepID=A0A9J7N159_BRAFL
FVFQLSLSRKFNNFIVIEKTKTVYCFIPKTGCTTTKLVFYNLEHDVNITDFEKDNSWIHRQTFTKLGSYSKEDIHIRLKTYNKFIVVRDPLERLVSAWLDKFVNSRSRWMYIHNYQRKTNTTYLQLITANGSASWKRHDDLPNVSFRDFIRAIIDQKYINGHWKTFYELCDPCQIEYDFIAHTDTLAEDFHLFFRKIGAVGKECILPRQHESRAERIVGNTFREVSAGDLRRIREIYKADFDMFGYSFDENLSLIKKYKDMP